MFVRHAHTLNFSVVLTLLLAFGAVASSSARTRVLVLSEFFNPCRKCPIEVRALNWLAPMGKILSEEIAVFEADSYAAAREKGGLNRYDVVMIWDLPRAVDKLTGLPNVGRREILDDGMLVELVSFVKEGGGLIVVGDAGTVFCEKNSVHIFDGNFHYYGDYYGYKDTAIEKILPVTFDEKGKLQPRQPALDVTSITGLFTDPKATPLTAGTQVEKGRVLAIVRGGRPVWEKEGILWDRAIRWAANKPPAEAALEAQLVQRYKELTEPPADKTPLEWVGDEYPFVTWNQGWFVGTGIACKYFRDLGFNRMSLHSTAFLLSQSPAGVKKIAQNAGDNSFWFYPTFDPWYEFVPKLVKENPQPADEWQAKTQDGQTMKGYFIPLVPSPHSPFTRKYLTDAARENVIKCREVIGTPPHFKGFIMDDEVTWNFPADSTKGLVTCYGKYSKQLYKDKTGHEAPLPQYRKPGYVAPAGDPWLKWVELIRMGGFRDYCRDIGNMIRREMPGALVGYWAGGHWGECDIIIDEFYTHMWKEDDTQVMMRTDLGFARLDDLKGLKTPYWSEIFLTKGSGCNAGNPGSALHPEQLRFMAGMGFSRGLRGLVLWEAPYIWQFSDVGQPPLDLEIKKLGDTLKMYGPMLQSLKREIPPVWYLGHWIHPNSFDHYHWLSPDIGSNPHPEWPWYASHCDNITWPALMRAQAPAAAVTERQLMSPELFHRKAVVLGSLQYCRREVVDNLEKFIRQGGRVFLDQTAAVKIKGATVLPCKLNSWYEFVAGGGRLMDDHNADTYDQIMAAKREGFLRDVLPVFEKEITEPLDPEVRVDLASRHKLWFGLSSVMKNGEARYLFVLNYDIKYGRVFDVSIKTNPGVVYDLQKQAAVDLKEDKGRFTFKSQLPAGGWRIYVLAPRKLAGLKVSDCKVAGNALKLRVDLEGEGGSFKAAVPVAITLTANNREATVYRSTDAGTGDFTIALGDYLKGVKKVTVKELLTNKEQAVTL